MNDHKQFDVICAGIATWDTLFTGIDSDLMETDGLLAEGYFASSGGDAVNAAVSMGRLGIRTAVCCSIGRDSAGILVKEDLKKAGVCTDHITESDHVNTAAPVLLIDHQGERHIIRVPDNGNQFFTKEMVPETLMEQASHLHVASANVLRMLDGKPLGDLFALAHRKGLTTSLDASYDKAHRGLEPVESALENCDIFIPSMQEARIYAGTDDIDEITRFFSKFPLRIFGVKLGEKGVFVTDFREKIFLDTLYHEKPVDTTGAGDAFLAGFVSAWIKGYDLKSCALVGSAQSASVLKVTGANRGAGTWKQAEELIEKEGMRLVMRKG